MIVLDAKLVKFLDSYSFYCRICQKIVSLSLQKGKMQEWLNWPAWKASKPQKGFGGSNPPLSAENEEVTKR